MTILRWIFFIPAGIIAGVFFSIVARMGACVFPDIVEFLAIGAGGAVGMIKAGLCAAPKKCAVVKWIMISLTVILGAFSALGSFIAAEDRLESAIGISMILVALIFSSVPADEIDIIPK